MFVAVNGDMLETAKIVQVDPPLPFSLYKNLKLLYCTCPLPVSPRVSFLSWELWLELLAVINFRLHCGSFEKCFVIMGSTSISPI